LFVCLFGFYVTPTQYRSFGDVPALLIDCKRICFLRFSANYFWKPDLKWLTLNTTSDIFIINLPMMYGSVLHILPDNLHGHMNNILQGPQYVNLMFGQLSAFFIYFIHLRFMA
jgi:hypothetical protein